MGTGWLLFLLISFLTGSPVKALVVVLFLWFLGDRFTFRLFPDPFRILRRASRRAELFTTLRRNPSDRRARFELAELLREAHRPSAGLTVLRPNLEAGDEDVHTAFLYGSLLARAGDHEKAVRILELARGIEPGYRMGEIDLELGRAKLALPDLDGARLALERLVAARPGTVQGRWLLSRALAAQGDLPAASRMKDAAYKEYTALPRFRRSEERPFAWRARPSRPIAFFVAVLAAVSLFFALVRGSTSEVRRDSRAALREN